MPIPINENQEIIRLLQEQNQTLKDLQTFFLKQEQQAKRMAILKFIIAAIPYLALIILAWFVYHSIQGYLDALNNNINALKASYDNLINSLKNLIPDFSQLNLENTWKSIIN